jgi:hypothetical protein
LRFLQGWDAMLLISAVGSQEGGSQERTTKHKGRGPSPPRSSLYSYYIIIFQYYSTLCRFISLLFSMFYRRSVTSTRERNTKISVTYAYHLKYRPRK